MSNDPKQLRNESVVSARACISISFPVICKIEHGGVHEAVVMFSMFPINRRCRSERDEIHITATSLQNNLITWH
jgi:hypothetical protein